MSWYLHEVILQFLEGYSGCWGLDIRYNDMPGIQDDHRT